MQKAFVASSLLVVSHVTHYRHGGWVFAYGPYAREVDVWAALVPELRIAAPVEDGLPPADALAFEAQNVRLVPQATVARRGRSRIAWRLAQLLALPAVIARLLRAMRSCDAVMVRCPGDLGLLGALLTRLVCPRRICKYAGSWDQWDGEPPLWRLQRAALKSGWWGAPVLVYGAWPNMPPHVLPWFSTAITRDQALAAQAAVAGRDPSQPPSRVIFVGQLSGQAGGRGETRCGCCAPTRLRIVADRGG